MFYLFILHLCIAFMADSFIQNNLNWIQGICSLSVYSFPGNYDHDFVSAML